MWQCVAGPPVPPLRLVGLDHRFSVALADGGRVGVYTGLEKLHGAPAAGSQIAIVIVRHHQSGIEVAIAQRFRDLSCRSVRLGQAIALAFARRVDELVAFDRIVIVDDSEPSVRYPPHFVSDPLLNNPSFWVANLASPRAETFRGKTIDRISVGVPEQHG